jgi:hypothetical protein
VLAGLAISISVASPARAPFALKREGVDLYLVRGGERLLLESENNWTQSYLAVRPVRLPGGYLVVPRVSRQNEPAREIVVLRDNQPWGKIVAEDMREGAPGHSAFITNMVPWGGSVLALLTWRDDYLSDRPILAQRLVRIRVDLKPMAETVRPLEIPGSLAPTYWYDVLRLFRFQNRLLLYAMPGEVEGALKAAGAELAEITPDGKIGGLFARLPAGYYPVGLVNGRWLILVNPDNREARPLWVFDLRAKRARPVPGDWNQLYFPTVPEKGDRILVHCAGSQKTWIVMIPGGKRIGLPDPDGSVALHLWQNAAIIKKGRSVAIYSARTGALLQDLPYAG